jgi:phosphoglycolate phosphatase-like HAD superfamily hydrolase
VKDEFSLTARYSLIFQEETVFQRSSSGFLRLCDCHSSAMLRPMTKRHRLAAHRSYTREDLLGLQPRHASFVGIDSDGCVFPTMEIKQKRCFHALIISHWHLETIEKELRETAEFVNLYSCWRGTNRFIALLKVFELLAERADVLASGAAVPRLPSLRRFVASGVPLGNPQIEQAVRETGDRELAAVLRWSQDINACVAATVKNVAPFPSVRAGLERIRRDSDAICVSQTPVEAIVREWEEHDLTRYVAAVAGQELGTKAEHLALAAGGKYAPDRILMIGDAPGDLAAARANQALFFPINPGHEERSWRRFCEEGYDRFLTGAYAGAYADALAAEFTALLPENPNWSRP